MSSDEPNTAPCPHCLAEVTFNLADEIVQCGQCSAHLIVDRSAAGPPQLVSLEHDRLESAYTTAIGRLEALPSDIARTQQAIETTQTELEQARVAYQQQRRMIERSVNPVKYQLAGLVALGLIDLYLVVVVLGGAIWYVALLIDLMLAYLIWRWFRRWRMTAERAAAQRQAAYQRIVQPAQTAFDRLTKQLADYQAEQLESQRAVSKYRFKEL
jgi:hypothetical protein